MFNPRRKRTHGSNKDHIDGHTGRRKNSTHDPGRPHRSDPPLVRNDHIGLRPTAGNARVAVAVVEEMGELETGQHDQPRRVDDREREADLAQGDGGEGGDRLDGESG